MKLYIKNMVCPRCILAVRQQAETLRLDVEGVALGEINFRQPPSPAAMAQLNTRLSGLGFEILDDPKHRIVEKIKNVVIEQVHHGGTDKHENFSDIVSAKLQRDYSYLSSLFSEVEGTTLEKYVIRQKVEKVKELIVYNQLNLSEIACQLGYSSVAHLSNQFKKVTGLSPSHFKKTGLSRRSIDQI